MIQGGLHNWHVERADAPPAGHFEPTAAQVVASVSAAAAIADFLAPNVAYDEQRHDIDAPSTSAATAAHATVAPVAKAETPLAQPSTSRHAADQALEVGARNGCKRAAEVSTAASEG